MAKREVMNENIEPFTLDNKQIKTRIEDTISYEESKYKDTEILFENKEKDSYKLPFSDFKVSIAQEIEENKLLLAELQKPELIEENVAVEGTKEVEVDEDPKINVLDEIYEFDEESKKPRSKYRSVIKKVDTEAIVERIKAEAREKNKGKKVISRRDINKELKPYMLKRQAGMNMDEDTLTSIDIYLNAVNRIETTNPGEEATQPTTPLELNLDDILNDLEK